MARPGTFLEVDRGYSPDLGKLLREWPSPPHRRAVSERSRRRHETVLERGLRPALVPQNYRAFLAASDLLSNDCSGKNRLVSCRFSHSVAAWGLAVRPALRPTMQRTGSVSPAAVSSSIALPSSPSTGAADPAILVIPAQARSGPSSQRKKKRTSSQTALCLAVFWKRLPPISFSIICLGSAENDSRAADGILPQL